MSSTIPVFVNASRLEVAPGTTAGQAAALADPGLAGRPGVGITDARGLPVAPETVLAGGAILRVAATARQAGGADADG